MADGPEHGGAKDHQRRKVGSHEWLRRAELNELLRAMHAALFE